MHTLVIRHIDASDPPAFQVVRLRDGKSTAPAPIRPPAGFPVSELVDGDLLSELCWYLEQFLDYPFPPATDRAERTVAALAAWGAQAFAALFGSGSGRDWYLDATSDGLEALHLHVASDDPAVLGWPWEALSDPAHGFVAFGCHIERKLNTVADPVPLQERLPRDRVNVLLITARPFEADVRFRSISRPLVELIDGRQLPAHVTVLRPPTLDRLRAHLAERPEFYHILHFDGHGGYGVAAGGAGMGSGAPHPHQFKSPQGHLAFEKDDGSAELVPADTLGKLLREYRLPVVVLNACQSGMIGGTAGDPFASVATALLRGGVRSVVAMAYSLYVSGAQEFLPAFYGGLFHAGEVAAATRAGRQQMLAQPGRTCARGRFPLGDWLVPVVYQQDPLDFRFARTARREAIERPALPEEARDSENPYGFVGRDGALLALERAMRRRPAAMLVHGLGGVGKTTLARGFVNWLAQTDGLGRGCFWLTFNDIQSADYVLNRLGEPLFGPQIATLGRDAKVEPLAAALRDHPFLIVWDNFESAAGIEAAGITGLLPAEDRAALKRFLERLRGGRTKVLITSRSEEAWLGQENRVRVPLGGLSAEERWELLDVIRRDLGLAVKRDDPDLAALMDLLEGHPLLMRAVIPRLEGMTARALTEAVKTNLATLPPTGDPALDKVFATLRFVEAGLAAADRVLLVPLGLHERYVDADYLEMMAQQADPTVTRARIDGCLAALTFSGLVWDVGQAQYQLHPALTSYLRAGAAAPTSNLNRDAWALAFVEVMGLLADAIAPRPLHEQRGVFHFHGANLMTATTEAERLGMDARLAALIQARAAFAQHTRAFGEAEALFVRLAEVCEKVGLVKGVAAGYHQLGRVAHERRDFEVAEGWYLKALEIRERQGDEHGAAISYHQLGRVAQERRDFEAAERWYKKSLEIKERQGNEHGAAMSYHQLGRVAEERQDLEAAERWYKKSLEIEERQGNEHGAAISYHNLGMVAQERRDFEGAERWYLKSLEVTERQGSEHFAAGSYHQLGMVAQERRDFEAAERWYLKSLEITERQGNEHGAAISYHQLGMVAEERRDFEGAERWYLKSLEVTERQGSEHFAAGSYHQLGIVALLQGRFIEAGQRFIKSVSAFIKTNDAARAQQGMRNFMILLAHAPPELHTELRAMWAAARLAPLPEGDTGA